ncbi:hypothetical protein NMY22_g7683 [Coprinellus aureogranulatus]|nr:hypothetical protein NMY22_g7683 [Coprinellus aureogranulatus]
MLGNASRAARLGAQKGYPRLCQRAFGRSCLSRSPQPNASIHLDPSTQALLQDVDMSLLNHKPRAQPVHRELEAVPSEEGQPPGDGFSDDGEGDWGFDDLRRKSPAALYGSRRIGAVVIPQQLQLAVTSIIEDSDKSRLHSDAMRLFAKMDSEENTTGWELQLDPKYKSYKQGARHAERDATAFVSIAMPGHYTAIYSVFEHLKHRMDGGFEVERVIDWGAGSYSGLWASLYAFQDPSEGFVEMSELEASRSTLKKYLGIEKRVGLVAIGNHLLQDVPVPKDLSVEHRKSIQGTDYQAREDGEKTLGLSAFVLSSLANPLQRKQMVKEMWESGAHTLVLIDHDNKAGFEAIAQAREYLLQLGRKELADPSKESLPIRGSHVVAPCSHDKECPLFTGGMTSKLVCGFSQRMQRPAFVRLTKHSKVGHEDVPYSYVVIQRGPRPENPGTKLGRMGLVGVREIEDQAAKAEKASPMKQLSLFDEQPEPSSSTSPQLPMEVASKETSCDEWTSAELDMSLREEAYYWPRLIVPPLKKSGHVILDSCTPEGKIMRLTIPKSQGKQPYYDARKSSWGDLFPHPPKNAPQERIVIQNKSGKIKAIEREHIGKSRRPEETKSMYDMVKTSVREAKKDKRKWDRFRKTDKIWNADHDE